MIHTDAARLQGNVDLTNAIASDDLITSSGADEVIVMEQVNISVYKAAEGGGGEVQIVDTAGSVLLRVDADSVKDIPTKDYGTGFRIAAGNGVQARAVGAGIVEASASVQITGYQSFSVA